MAVRGRERSGRSPWPPIGSTLKLVGAAVVIHEEFIRQVTNNILVGAAIVCIAGVQVIENVLADLVEKIWAKDDPNRLDPK